MTTGRINQVATVPARAANSAGVNEAQVGGAAPTPAARSFRISLGRARMKHERFTMRALRCEGHADARRCGCIRRRWLASRVAEGSNAAR